MTARRTLSSGSSEGFYIVRYVMFVLIILIVPSVVSGAERPIIPVWPNLNVPVAQRANHLYYPSGRPPVIGRPILWPTLKVFMPSPDKANQCAIVICTGGGYMEEAIALEGYRVARRFNQLGVTCFVLKYRLPQGKLPRDGVPYPLQDVRRAVQIIRAHAQQWHIDPHHVGVMGFSAGGSVASLAGVHWLPGNPDARDPLNHYSTRPDFMVLAYPMISMLPGITNKIPHNALLGKHPPLDVERYFSSELNVTPLTPPAFICYAHDDHGTNHQNAKRFYAALRRNGISAKLVEYKHGGHGFGLGKKGTDSVQWPGDCAKWLKKMGFLTAAKKSQS